MEDQQQHTEATLKKKSQRGRKNLFQQELKGLNYSKHGMQKCVCWVIRLQLKWEALYQGYGMHKWPCDHSWNL